MAKFASAKNAYGISDRSGFRYRLKDMRKEWTGMLVGPDEWEPKQPQLGPFRKVVDPQALRDPRPETNLAEERSIQYGFDPVGFKDIPGITPPNNLVAVGSVGTVVVNPPPTVDSVTGVSATAAVGSVTVSTVVVPKFSSTTVTLDSSTDTFDEG